MEDKFITAQQAATMLGVCIQTVSNDGRRHTPKLKRYRTSTIDGYRYAYKLKEIELLKGSFGRRVKGVGAGKKVPTRKEVHIDIGGKRWPETTTINISLPKPVAMAKVKSLIGPDVPGLVTLTGVTDGIVWCMERF